MRRIKDISKETVVIVFCFILMMPCIYYLVLAPLIIALSPVPLGSYKKYIEDPNYPIKVKARILDYDEVNFGYTLDCNYHDQIVLGETIGSSWIKPEVDRNNGIVYAFFYDGTEGSLCFNYLGDNVFPKYYVARNVPIDAVSINNEELELITLGHKI